MSYTNWSEIEGLERAWNSLLAQSSARTIFLSWEWVQAWWSAFGARRGLVLLTCIDSEGTLVAIAPLQRTWEETGPRVFGWLLRLVGDGIGGSENLDWVVREGYEAAAVSAFVDWLDQHRSLWDAIGLNTVPATSPVMAAVRAELRRRGWRQVERPGTGYVRRLPESWEALLASLSKNKRTQISTRLRKLQDRFSVRVRRCERLEELPECLEHLMSLHQKRWGLRGEAGSFALEQKRTFYLEMAQKLLLRGWLDFWLLELDGKTVAAEFGFHYSGTYSFLQAGFDPEFASYSVGVVLRAHIMQELIARGLREYDFLGGDDQYKHSWGAESRNYVFLSCARPYTRAAVGLVLDISVEKTKNWLRTRTPKVVWQTIRGAYRRLIPPGSAR
jgi:CelD/BcsL family acetyltransferase involved in cellulose biosynthesis